MKLKHFIEVINGLFRYDIKRYISCPSYSCIKNSKEISTVSILGRTVDEGLKNQ